MRVSLQPAWVLHRRPYRDSSALLEVLTPEYGRLGLVARGARRRGRGAAAAALLQPFRPLLLSFSGRGELKTLTASEAAGPGQHLPGERIYSGLYLNELLVRLLHRQDPHPLLFAAYGSALAALGEQPVVDAALRRFELALLGELGYGLELGRDGISGMPVAAGCWYRFLPEAGLVEVPDAATHGALAAGLFSGDDLLAMAAGQFTGDRRRAARQLLRQALACHLGDAPLKSRELFAAQRGQARIGDDPTPTAGGAG